MQENLPDIKQPKSLLRLFGQETKQDNKASVKVKTEPNKKKDKAVVPEVTETTKMEVEEATVKPEAMPENVEKISDPGWDFSVTGVTLPAWGKVTDVFNNLSSIHLYLLKHCMYKADFDLCIP